ncbi:hypothetical protein C9413_10310 [Rhizobium sp. SEMIA 4085]|nr:hypothetical protein [Rhizobium sp. SEMIA 4085]
MDIPPEFPFKSGEITRRIEDGGNYLEFKWAPATPLSAAEYSPYFFAGEIETLPASPRHLAGAMGIQRATIGPTANIDATGSAP